MEGRERLDFMDAQRRFLDRCGVVAQSRFVDVPSIGGQAHCLVAGDGPPVLMVNGIGTPGAMWAPLMAHLGGFRVHALDLPAYGLTDTTPRFADDLRSNAVRFLDEAVQALGFDRVAFIANSMGSLWTSWLALDRPHRVAALVHVGCPAVVLESSAPLPMRLLSVGPLGRLLTRLQAPSRRQVEQMSRMVGEHPLPTELVDLLVATQRLPGFRRTFLSTLHALLRLRGSRREHRLTEEQLRRIQQPALLFWGEADPFGSPAVAQRVAAALHGAELRIVGGGHCPWLKRAVSIGAETRRFLHQHA